MNKPLISFLSLLAFGVTAKAIVKPLAAPREIETNAMQMTLPLSMEYVLTSLYDDKNYKVPNYYVILSNNENAKYNSNTGDISAPAGTFTLILDCFNYTPEDGVYLPEGTYEMLADDNNPTALGFTYEYSMLNFYNENGDQSSTQLENPVVVRRDENGRYKITTTVEVTPTEVYEVTYSGPLTFGTSTEKPTVYPQITHNVTGNLDKGGISFYQGVTDASSQGVSYLNLYDVKFDNTNGYMEGPGLNLSMMIAHKRFTKRASYAICPGTYTNAKNLARDTWYPCREIEYMGIVMPFGSYLRELKVVDGERNYTYAYLKTGEFTIIDNGDGTFKGELHAETTLGYTVDLTWSGEITLNTDNASFQATVSDLTDDVELDFSKLEKGRIYHTGIVGGCRTFIVDLGSPSGKDPGINNGGDLLRMEFLSDANDHLLKPGLYTVVPRRWNSDELRAGGKYEPMSLNKGYFGSKGDQIGTRYAHFREGSDCVYDMVGPAEEGSVRVETEDYINYRFTIDLMDDAGFKITGYWDKPIEYNYNAEALKQELGAIDEVVDDSSAIHAVIEGTNLFVINAGNAPVALYSIDGRLLATTTADQMISISDFEKGIYIIKVQNSTIKIRLL